MGLLFSEGHGVLWIALSSIAFYGPSVLLDLEVITRWTNGLAKHKHVHQGNIRELCGALSVIEFIVQLPLEHLCRGYCE